MEQENEIDLREFFSIIRKRAKLIILITLIATVIAGVLSWFVIPPTYEAKTSIIIGKDEKTSTNSQQTNNDIMMYQNLIKTYSEIAKSDVVAANAARKLDNKISLEQIKSKITVSPQQGTQLIYIKVKGKTPRETYDIASAISDSFIEEAKSRMSSGSALILDRAVLPKNPVKPKKILNLAIAFFIGLLVSVGIAFLLEYMDNTIKNEKDIEKYLEIPVIGSIPNNIEE